MRDARANFETISMSWFDYPDGSDELKAARSQQLANRTILQLQQLYEARLHEVGMDLIAKENPDLIQTTDVDQSQEENQDG